MTYTKTNWTNQTPINTTNLNKIENGIEEVSNAINGTESMGNIVVDSMDCNNVLNKALFVDNKYLWFDGTEHDDNNTKYWRTGLQKIKPNTTYYCNKKMTSVILYDLYRKPLRAISDITEILTTSNEYYIQISFAKSIVVIDGEVILSKMPNSDYVSNIDSSNLEHYSTTEQIIGTWIDGKPIYKKTILQNTFTAGESEINHNISDVERIVNISGIAYRTDGSAEPIPTLCPPDYIKLWQLSVYDVNHTRYRIYVGSSLISDYAKLGELYLTLEYTKTTD